MVIFVWKQLLSRVARRVRQGRADAIGQCRATERGNARRLAPPLTAETFINNFRCLQSDYYLFHHQPINAPTAGAQAFLMDYTKRERAITHGWWVLTTANAAETNGLTCLPKNGGARDNKFLVTHPMTGQRCLTSAIERQSALAAGPSSSSFSLSLRGYSQKPYHNWQILHTYHLTLDPRWGSRGILDILLRRPRFNKITYLWGILQTWQVGSPLPSDRSLS
jgi:hypothetical protein